jgi:hypothetical protein
MGPLKYRNVHHACHAERAHDQVVVLTRRHVVTRRSVVWF